MARVSYFSEHLDSASIITEAPSTTKGSTYSSSLSTMAGKIKAALLKPYHGYKQHTKLIVNTNFASTQSKEHNYGIDAGSMSYGSRTASEEELRKQYERNHLGAIFGQDPGFHNQATII
ncbi:hypothetical protein BGW36DRAFT_433406 [Talaromyces proteolyticus]|uniref:Uncharacterized protein n=1 Tax=Talaromyces proteolyticus TaxID=1131652 RepID=A0AAD4KIN5_9EURO|nr:uncharacterized protein BGW36DRAFT_433406 [Talaromyces proteolyticus]KAH8689405.1 hypothetical protein BGW36DRAFT_433406 [Talaromyces proteolyticus]